MYPFIAPVILKLYEPLFMVHTIIKDNYYVKEIIFRICKKTTFILFGSNYISFSPSKIDYYFYIIFHILPRVILIILFYIDIFYFHTLHLIYTFILLSAIPLFLFYGKYLLSHILEEYIQKLEPWYEVKILSTDPNPDFDYAGSISGDGDIDFKIRSFLQEQKCCFRQVKYECTIIWDIVHKYYPEIYFLSDITKEQRIFLTKEFEDIMPTLINMSQIVSRIYIFFEIRHEEMKKINIILYSLHIFAWIYILFVSRHTFNITELEYMIIEEICKNMQDKIEPFTDINIYDAYL
jgi:hypothetical protein